MESDKDLVEDVASDPKSVIEPSKTDQEFSEDDELLKKGENGSLNDEIEMKNGSQESEASSTDTEEFADVDDSSSAKTLDDLAFLLIQSRASRRVSSTSQTPVISNHQPITKGEVEFIQSADASSSEDFSSDSTILLDGTDKSASMEHANDLMGGIDRAACDLICSSQQSPAKMGVQKDVGVAWIVKKFDPNIGSEVKASDSELTDEKLEQEDSFNSAEALPQISSFLTSGVDELDDDLEIDDDVLRAEADKYERLAQETTSDCVAEAQVRKI